MKWLRFVVYSVTTVVLTGCTPVDSARPSTVEMDDEQFTKPAKFRRWKNIFHTTEEYDTSALGTMGSVVTVEPREFMHPSEFSMALWLYEGEPVVVDVGYKIWGFDEPQTYDVLVLVNFEPVPFGLIDSGQTSQLLSDEDAIAYRDVAPRQEITLKPGATHGFTYVLPAGTFQEKAAYDVRIVPLWRGKPDTERRAVRDRTRLGSTFVVYHEGYEFAQRHPRRLPSKYTIIDLGVREIMGDGIAAVLPYEIYDLLRARTVPEAAPIRYGQAFSVPFGSEIEMNGYLVGITEGWEDGDVAVVTFDNTRVISEASGMVTTRKIEGPDRTSRYEDGSIGDKFSNYTFSVTATEQQHVIRTIKFPHPYTRFDVDEEAYLVARRAYASQLVFLRAEDAP